MFSRTITLLWSRRVISSDKAVKLIALPVSQLLILW